jgi:hypothetical protein
MCNTLNKSKQRHVVFVSIEGLLINANSLEIGTVTFYPRSNDCEFDQALEDVYKQRNIKPSDLLTDFKKIKCYAKVEVSGEFDFVLDEAIHRTKMAIHILNLYRGSLKDQTKYRSISYSQFIITRLLDDDTNQNNDVGFLESYSPYLCFEIDQNKVNYWAQMDLNTMNSYYQSNSDTDIGKRVQRATNWYSKAVDTNSPEEKFVNLAIALENLLIGDEGQGPYITTGSINQKIGERVAFLLGKDFDSRREIEKEAKDLYTIRSKIVHKGEVVTTENLKKMDKLVNQVIISFLQHKFTNWEEFRNWIDHQKYDRQQVNTNTI